MIRRPPWWTAPRLAAALTVVALVLAAALAWAMLLRRQVKVQAALLAARLYYEKDKADSAKAALAWVAEKSADEGLQAIARLRLAGLALEAKAYDEALAQLGNKMPAAFAALADDRRGDVLLAQGKSAEAKAHYGKAYAAMDERAEYRRLLEVKLNALGVDVAPAAEGKK